MINTRNLKLPGEIKLGKHKSIHCQIHLKIQTYEYDERSNADIEYNPNDFIDGMRVFGEFYFDSSPIQFNDCKNSHPIKKNAVGELIIMDGKDSTKINALITDFSGEINFLDNRIKRYFWQFVSIGKPSWDRLHIFPSDYRGVNMNRVYVCTDFRGEYWPVEVSSVIVAADKNEAKVILDNALRDAGIPLEGNGYYTITEVSLNQKNALILNNGNRRF